MRRRILTGVAVFATILIAIYAFVWREYTRATASLDASLAKLETELSTADEYYRTTAHTKEYPRLSFEEALDTPGNRLNEVFSIVFKSSVLPSPPLKLDLKAYGDLFAYKLSDSIILLSRRQLDGDGTESGMPDLLVKVLKFEIDDPPWWLKTGAGDIWIFYDLKPLDKPED